MSHPQDPAATATPPTSQDPQASVDTASSPTPAVSDPDAEALLRSLDEDLPPTPPPSAGVLRKRISSISSATSSLDLASYQPLQIQSALGDPTIETPSLILDTPPSSYLLIADSIAPLRLTQDETLLGREDPSAQIFPDIDLTPFDALLNVSRRHAKIIRTPEGFFLEPLSSAGTDLNGVEIPPLQRAPLHHGANILLAGRVKISFLLSTSHLPEPSPPPSKVDLFLPQDTTEGEDLTSSDLLEEDAQEDLRSTLPPPPAPPTPVSTPPTASPAAPIPTATKPSTLPPPPPAKPTTTPPPKPSAPPKPPTPPSPAAGSTAVPATAAATTAAPQAPRRKADEIVLSPAQLKDLMAGGRADEAYDLNSLPFEDNRWYEEVFNEDYLRLLPHDLTQQTEREVNFVANNLGLSPNSRVLDLGCGFGRHTIELSRKGFDMVGLDLSMPLLQRALADAQRRNLVIKFIHGDMRQLNFDAIFDGVICLHTSFGYFNDQANFKVLQGIYRALKPGGRLLIETINRDFIAEGLPMRVWWSGTECLVLEEIDLHPMHSILQVKRSIVFDDHSRAPWEQHMNTRLYSSHEMGALMRRAGFRVLDLSGDFSHPSCFFGNASKRVILLAERPAR
jgi:SAM-dependent methyltransferase